MVFVIPAQSPIDTCHFHPYLAKEISQYKKLYRHQPFWAIRADRCLIQTLWHIPDIYYCPALLLGKISGIMYCPPLRRILLIILYNILTYIYNTINRTLLTQDWFYKFLYIVPKSRVREQKDVRRRLWALDLSVRSVRKEGGREIFLLLFIFWLMHMPPNFLDTHLAEGNCPKFPLQAVDRDKIFLKAYLRYELLFWDYVFSPFSQLQS